MHVDVDILCAPGAIDIALEKLYRLQPYLRLYVSQHDVMHHVYGVSCVRKYLLAVTAWLLSLTCPVRLVTELRVLTGKAGGAFENDVYRNGKANGYEITE